jgi:glycerate 2-kinase
MLNPKIIKNRDQLETTDLRRKALDIVEAGIERVLPSAIMHTALAFDREAATITVNKDQYKLRGRLFVIGAGKASGLMAQTLEKIVGAGAITAGLIIEKASPGDFATTTIRIVQAGHPLPDQRGVNATQDLLALKQQYTIGADDLVLCLISGGGSALMACPLEGISLEDKRAATSLLISCGADIDEINAVRKHLSGTKGGHLAKHFAPAQVISLILSDVIGNNLSVIASGPTYPDLSTFAEAYGVLQKYQLGDKVPGSVIAVLQKGCRGDIAETPKTVDNAHNYIIGDVRLALEAMVEKARRMGFKPLIVSAHQRGDTAGAAAQIAQKILGGEYSGYDALLIGGETTPALPAGHGQGGRNQHYAACTIAEFKGYRGEWVLASAGTDGSDFMPDFAGAIVDDQSLEFFKGREPDLRKGIELFDSHRLLSLTGNSLIMTGNTHTNVGDISLYLFRVRGSQV